MRNMEQSFLPWGMWTAGTKEASGEKDNCLLACSAGSSNQMKLVTLSLGFFRCTPTPQRSLLCHRDSSTGLAALPGLTLEVQLIPPLTQLAGGGGGGGGTPSLWGFALRICILHSPSTLDLSLPGRQQLEYRKQGLPGEWPGFQGQRSSLPRAACKALSRSDRRLAGINNQLGRVGCRNVARQGDLPLSTSRASTKVAGGRRDNRDRLEGAS